MIAQFIDQHVYVSMSIVGAAMLIIGYAAGDWRRLLRTERLENDRDSTHLLWQYENNPLPAEDDLDDDWTGYQERIRPETAARLDAMTELAITEVRQARNFTAYTREIPEAYDIPWDGTPGYQPRHSAEPYTEVQVRTLNTSTCEFDKIVAGLDWTTGFEPQGNVDEIGDKAESCVPPKVGEARNTWEARRLAADWRQQVAMPASRELVPV